MTFDGRAALSLVMALLFAGGIVLVLGLPEKARFMPLLVAIPGLILCLAQFVIDLRAPREAKKGASGAGNDDSRSEIEVFVWLGLFAAAIIGFGFLIGGSLIVAAFVRFSSKESWLNAIFAGAGTFAVLYGVFIWLLELSIFEGLILEAVL